jgi:cell division protein FtsL
MVRKKIPRRQILLGLTVFILIILILTFYLRHLTETARLGLVLRDLEVRLSRLQDEIRTLEARKAALLSLSRVEKVAREELKLTEPQPGQVVFEDVNEPHK